MAHWGGRIHSAIINIACVAFVTFRTAQMLVLNYSLSNAARSNRGAHTQKNPHGFAWDFILAHWGADSLGNNKYCLRGIRNVSHGTNACAQLLIVERCAFKSRGAHAKKSPRLRVGLYFGAPGAIRTRSPRLRRAMLYPVEPRVQVTLIINIPIQNARI